MDSCEDGLPWSLSISWTSMKERSTNIDLAQSSMQLRVHRDPMTFGIRVETSIELLTRDHNGGVQEWQSHVRYNHNSHIKGSKKSFGPSRNPPHFYPWPYYPEQCLPLFLSVKTISFNTGRMPIYQTLSRSIWLATGKGSNSPSSTKISINRYNKICPMHLSANMFLGRSGPSRRYQAKPLTLHTVQLYHRSPPISQPSPRMSFNSLTKFLSSRTCRYGVFYRLVMIPMSEFLDVFWNFFLI